MGDPSDLVVVCDQLKRTFPGGGQPVTALAGIDLTIRAGEYVALRGPSGSGKSTLLHCIGALDRGYTGSLRVLGFEPAKLRDRELSRFRGQRIGFVFQAFNLLPHLSALENVLVPAVLTGVANERIDRARKLLDRVGLGDRLNARPGELSGGQQQRVAVARSLILDAPLLVCDEPTGSLDEQNGDAIMQLLEEARAERGATLLIVTHEPHIAARAQRQVTLRDGKVVEDTGAAP